MNDVYSVARVPAPAGVIQGVDTSHQRVPGNFRWTKLVRDCANCYGSCGSPQFRLVITQRFGPCTSCQQLRQQLQQHQSQRLLPHGMHLLQPGGIAKRGGRCTFGHHPVPLTRSPRARGPFLSGGIPHSPPVPAHNAALHTESHPACACFSASCIPVPEEVSNMMQPSL
jgi:hypothetical protein